MSFAMPANRIRWYPRRMYAELRDYVMRENTKYAASAEPRCQRRYVCPIMCHEYLRVLCFVSIHAPQMHDSLTPNPPHVSGQRRLVRADLGSIQVIED